MPDFSRYHRQMLLPGFGDDAQQRLSESHVLLVGCGALGTVIADALCRAGVGTLTIVDRDIVELTNLQRQVLYVEADAAAGTPKAIAAREALSSINSDVQINAHVDDFNRSNAAGFGSDVDLIVDGLDNFETRYLLNDLAVRQGIPYVYGGAVGFTGMGLVILPCAAHDATTNDKRLVTWKEPTPCLRCIFPEAPPPGTTATCDTAGVLGPVVGMVASWQAVQVLKLLAGDVANVDRCLLSLDMRCNEIRGFNVGADGPDPVCPCCGQRSFGYLEGQLTSQTTSLCGRHAVQVIPERAFQAPGMSLHDVATRLAPHGAFTANDHLLRGTFSEERGDEGMDVELTLFPNGRAILKGITAPETARRLYARYIGT